ncbi:Severin [Grifola frondosa]|uniref:Severin n=1 Tax=Grifola frondosa TaxID=5627 RepID=A0A1C7M2Z5_GRIFR|nr:Severin [Grifola frondosa]
MLLLCITLILSFVTFPIASQQIYDIWATTWDRAQLFTYTNLSPSPLNFVSPGAIGAADITVDDSTLLQNIDGFGASLTDSSALILNNLKNQNPDNYWAVLNMLFDPTDGADAAGLSYLRVPLGASDFSANTYSFDDVSDDTALTNFNINNAPSYLFSVINDIQSINSYLKVHILPWSPPGWMKDSGTMNGGSFLSGYTTTYANYLLKCLQGFQSHGIDVYAIGVQNEPENSNDSYPTCLITAIQEAQIGLVLRSLMDSNGFSGVRIIGYEHNWDDAAGYPVQLMQQAPSAFAGVSFHCYAGNVTEQDDFHNAFPDKEIYFTECTGEYGSDWWSDIKWYIDNIFVGSVEHSSMNGLMWNLALDGNGDPKLPGTTSCGTPCRPVVTVNSDGSYSYNQEFYVMAQASKAILPRDSGGPFGQSIGVSVGGTLNWALRVTAFVTGRVNPTDWLRYSLLVMNWDDEPNGSWDPTPVQTTIEFRGMQATYTFPVGVTTLWCACLVNLHGPSHQLTKYDIKDSNILRLRLEKRVREHAGDGEVAWQRVGQQTGTQVWRIEQFAVKEWPQTRFGCFYDGDSYIVLHTYKKTPEAQELSYDLHFWLGEDTTQDEAGTAAYKTVELDDHLGGTPVQYREVQSYESPRFLSYFPRFVCLRGGVATGFHHVSSPPPENTRRLYQISAIHLTGHSAHSSHLQVREVAAEGSSLIQGHVYVLDLGSKIWQFNTRKSVGKERYKAAEFVQSLVNERHTQCATAVYDELWGGSGKVPICSRIDSVPDIERVEAKSELALFRLSDATGTVVFNSLHACTLNPFT